MNSLLQSYLPLPSPVPPRHTKLDLRTTLKAALVDIPPASRIALSNQLTKHLLNSTLYQSSATTILAYAALPTEISLDPFITTALANGKRICIPQIDWASKSMRPAQINNLDTDLETGRYAVRTPHNGCPVVDTKKIDLILIPGLAFDTQGRRLGRGAGFYDRMIDSLPSPRPLLVGVCFANQIVETVPTEPHDHPMDRVITENGFIKPQ